MFPPPVVFGIANVRAYTCQYEMAPQALNREARIACLPFAVFSFYSLVKHAERYCCHDLYIFTDTAYTHTVLLHSVITCPTGHGSFYICCKGVIFRIVSIVPIPIPMTVNLCCAFKLLETHLYISPSFLIYQLTSMTTEGLDRRPLQHMSHQNFLVFPTSILPITS